MQYAGQVFELIPFIVFGVGSGYKRSALVSEVKSLPTRSINASNAVTLLEQLMEDQLPKLRWMELNLKLYTTIYILVICSVLVAVDVNSLS